MSLIDDALRRAREEAALREAAGRPGSSRWAPSHIPGRKRSSWSAALGFAAVFLAGGSVAWLLLARNPARGIPRATSSSSSLSAPGTSPIVAAPVTRSAFPAPRPAPAVSEPRTRPKALRRPSEPGPLRSRAASEQAVRAPVPAATPAAPGSAGLPSPVRKTYVRQASIGGETIELGGIVYSEGNPVALINGKVVGPGSLVGDYAVVRIRPEQVDFSGNGAAFSILLR